MTDKELLELAAKTVGKNLEQDNYRWVDDYCYTGFEQLNQCPESFELLQSQYWNPLDDNADAFRLAVEVNATIYHTSQSSVCCSIGLYPTQEQTYDGNKLAATRRAIVRAAAAIEAQK